FAPLGLPAGQYLVASRTDADGITVLALMDKVGRQIATVTSSAEGSTMSARFYDEAGDLVKVCAPSFFAPPGGQAASTVVSSASYDFRHRVLSLTMPDSATTQFVYAPAGRLRFMQDAEGAKQGYYCYWDYDA